MRLRTLTVSMAAFLLILSGCRKTATQDVEAARDRQFKQMMSGSTLVGYSAFDNKVSQSREEHYQIDNVSRLTGDTWLFQTKLRYGSREIPVPIPITIKWAGDTPVITLDELSIPGVGTYTARVILHRDRYAGTWSGKKAGGQLYGKIVPSGAPSVSAPDASAKPGS
ncbi:MAG: hypothetical protein H7039_22460 [Bryobacteraceae bacterium]|nr:hypothetical protein [Bryobacteraceae bacterium]